MDMLLLKNKRLIIISLCLLFSFNLFSNSIKKETDKTMKKIRKDLICSEIDLSDYYPHVDGVANIYVDKTNKFKSFVNLSFFTSMYKKEYYVCFNNDRVFGYIEKITYAEPYDTGNSSVELESEFSYSLKQMKSQKAEIDKYILVALELLEEK